MGHYLRYITTDSRPITLATLTHALQQMDAAYTVYLSDIDVNSGDLYHMEWLLGVLEINSQGEEIFEEDIADLKELVEFSNNVSVLETLNQAKAIIAVEAIWQGNNSEATLRKLDALWDWLFANYDGLLQVDNEGFYDQDNLIFELDLKI